MNRRIRGPYVRWCERAGAVNLGRLSLLDFLQIRNPFLTDGRQHCVPGRRRR